MKEIVDYYNIHTDVEGCMITPLHYLFGKYISDDSMSGDLLDKLESILIEETNIKTLVQLTKEGKDSRKIEEDSFLDGGIFLLWCLKYNRVKLLQHFLGENMIQFWRFAQLKTLLWACFQQKNENQ